MKFLFKMVALYGTMQYIQRQMDSLLDQNPALISIAYVWIV